MLSPIKKHLLLAVGFLNVALAFIGAFLPLLPTTPFAILAAFCFSKSSPRLHQWLRDLPYLGEGLRKWEEHKSISITGKILCTLLLTASMSYPFFFKDFHWGLKLAMALTWVGVLSFVLSRPSGPKNKIGITSKTSA